jgi:hypothetical protein
MRGAGCPRAIAARRIESASAARGAPHRVRLRGAQRADVAHRGHAVRDEQREPRDVLVVQVHVHVPQPRHEEAPRAVHHRRAARHAHRVARPRGHDAPVAHHDRPAAAQRGRGAVGDVHADDRQRGRAGHRVVGGADAGARRQGERRERNEPREP